MIHRLSLLFLFLISALSQAQGVTEYLKPPSLQKDALAAAVSCDRPRRSSGVNISLEDRDGKTIVHCYGHGGFGFTTLFGSIQEALALLLKRSPDYHTPIRIIGTGCMGLTMAIELSHAGFTNIAISTKEKYSIPSWRAGGFFDPGVGTETSETSKHHVALALNTYSVLHQIEHGEHPYLTKPVVKRLPIYCPIEMQCGVELLPKLGLTPEAQLVTLDFGNGVIHEGYKKQYTYFINVTGLMSQLWHHIEQLQIPVTYEEITSFAHCTEPIICNCTGLGSQTLNADSAMMPTRGHFFMLAQSDEEPLDYMLFTKVVQNGKKEIIYFFPKPAYQSSADECMHCAGMLGGTFIPCGNLDDAQKRELDTVEFAKLAERAQGFFYSKSLL